MANDPNVPGGPGGFGGVDLGALMQQAQKMQQEMQRSQDELAKKTVEATAGGGMVQVVVTGARELVSLRIDPQAIDPRDPQMLQDLIVAAVNQGLRKAQALAEDEMRRAAQGLGLPLGMI